MNSPFASTSAGCTPKNGSVADLAAAYGVSGVAMAWRLYNVGLGPQPSAG